MGSSKSLKTPAFLKKSDLLLFFSSLLIGLKWQEFSNVWMIPFTGRIDLFTVVCVSIQTSNSSDISVLTLGVVRNSNPWVPSPCSLTFSSAPPWVPFISLKSPWVTFTYLKNLQAPYGIHVTVPCSKTPHSPTLKKQVLLQVGST